jgi:hypothetical protein
LDLKNESLETEKVLILSVLPKDRF